MYRDLDLDGLDDTLPHIESFVKIRHFSSLPRVGILTLEQN